MDIIDELNRLDRVHNLIRVQTTGSAVELAEKIGVSERTAFRLIAILKNIGCPIYFNKFKNSYCYEYPVKLIFLKLEEKTLDSKELTKIIGGNENIFLQIANFWQSDYVPLRNRCETGIIF